MIQSMGIIKSSRLMKTFIKTIWQSKRLACAGAMFATALTLGAASDAPAAPAGQLEYSWAFATGDNPSAPATSGAGAASASAAITTGFGTIGWLSSNAALGTAAGIWDLGQNGKITLNATSSFTGASTPASELRVKVVQWIDGGIYYSHAGVSASGAHVVSTNSTPVPGISPPGGLGEWILEETVWNVDAGASVASVLVSGANPDSVIDSVTITAIPVGEPVLPVLTIVPVNLGGQVKISWPTNFSSMTLQSNAEADNPSGWSPVGLPPQIDAGGNYVIIDATNALQYYRLKQY
jgi:hypothetical protein